MHRPSIDIRIVGYYNMVHNSMLRRIKMAETPLVKRFSRIEAQTILLNYKNFPFERLNQLFMESITPTYEEIAGETAGVIVLCPKCGWSTKFLATVLFNCSCSRWKGKIFISPFEKDQAGKVLNQYGNRLAPRRFTMLSSIEPATSDRKSCVKLTYAFPLSTFRAYDEIRKVEDGVFLGQTYQKLPFTKKYELKAYFILCALKTS
jgi:hypothetical protein